MNGWEGDIDCDKIIKKLEYSKKTSGKSFVWDSNMDAHILAVLVNLTFNGVVLKSEISSIYQKGLGASNKYGEIMHKGSKLCGWRTEKVALISNDKYDQTKIDQKEHEFRLSCDLSNLNIAPKIKGMYVVKLNPDNGEPAQTKMYELLFPYDGDLHSFIKDNGSQIDTGKIEEQLYLLLWDLAKYSFFCGDIKPANAVYKRTKTGGFEVRLIDWDTHFCNRFYPLSETRDPTLPFYCMAALFVITSLTTTTKTKKIPLYNAVMSHVLDKQKLNDLSNYFVKTKFTYTPEYTPATMAFYYYFTPCIFENSAITVETMKLLLQHIFINERTTENKLDDLPHELENNITYTDTCQKKSSRTLLQPPSLSRIENKWSLPSKTCPAPSMEGPASKRPETPITLSDISPLSSSTPPTKPLLKKAPPLPRRSEKPPSPLALRCTTSFGSKKLKKK